MHRRRSNTEILIPLQITPVGARRYNKQGHKSQSQQAGQGGRLAPWAWQNSCCSDYGQQYAEEQNNPQKCLYYPGIFRANTERNEKRQQVTVDENEQERNKRQKPERTGQTGGLLQQLNDKSHTRAGKNNYFRHGCQVVTRNSNKQAINQMKSQKQRQI